MYLSVSPLSLSVCQQRIFEAFQASHQSSLFGEKLKGFCPSTPLLSLCSAWAQDPVTLLTAAVRCNGVANALQSIFSLESYARDSSSLHLPGERNKEIRCPGSAHSRSQQEHLDLGRRIYWSSNHCVNQERIPMILGMIYSKCTSLQ